jgi:hypothetical protein
MITILRLLLGLLAIILSGLPITLTLLPSKLRQSLLFIITISFAIGVGNISFVMMLLSMLKINFSLTKILLFLIFFTVIYSIGFTILIFQKGAFKNAIIKTLKSSKKSINQTLKIQKKISIGRLNPKNKINIFNKQKLFAFRRYHLKNNESKKHNLFKIIEITLLTLILFQIVTSIFIAIIFPVRFWDAITCWSFKGRAFFLDKNIYDFYNKHSYEFSHPSYPLLLPFLQTYLYFYMGVLNENLMKILFPIFYISLLIVNYSFLRIRYSEINPKVDNNSGKIKKDNRILRKNYIKITSLFFTFILSTVPIIFDHAYIEYTNLAFAFYLFLSVIFMTLWIKSRENRLLILSAIFAVQLSLLRSEGILFSVFIFIMLIFYLLKSKEYIFRSKEFDDKSLFLKEDKKINWNCYNYNKYKKIYLCLLVLVVMSVYITPWLLIKSKLNLDILGIDWACFQNSIIYFKENFRSSVAGLINEFILSKYDSTNSFFKSSYSIYWIIIILVFIFYPKKVIDKENRIMLSVIIFTVIVYLIGSSLIPDFLTSMERYLLHIFPISFFLAVSAICKKPHSLVEELDLNI